MGLRDQFQDKARRLAEQAEARAAAQGTEAEAGRAPTPVQEVGSRTAQVRDALDDALDK
ncbi:hypothetical protein ACWGHM_39470 [Streptomyces sp. NPDC054904]|uniref:hypothetical protein n=1 Tax=unclassified Streptomyces TaxID=2593676 RepID=UPI0024820105|nr:hypothetical protein [Streptomyces sp. Isolate_45]MDA5285128.1 hypothetical protein [Streptomyces sp. Isolate_45]